MVERIFHCLKKKLTKIKIIVKMLFKIVRRKDPIELNYDLFNIKKAGSLIGAIIF